VATTATAVRRKRAGRHRRRADCYSRSQRKSFTSHFTLHIPAGPFANNNARRVSELPVARRA
jgi:hypothetical protein